MNVSNTLQQDQYLVISPDKKVILAYIIFGFVIIPVGLWFFTYSHFFSWFGFVCVIGGPLMVILYSPLFFSKHPLLIFDEQGIHHFTTFSRMFVRRQVTARWEEVARISLMQSSAYVSSFKITISPDHLETFLLRNYPSLKKISRERLLRDPYFMHIPLDVPLLRPQERTSKLRSRDYLALIEEHCQTPIQQYHIKIQDQTRGEEVD